MPCFQRVHRLRLSCRLALRLITRRRVFFIFAHTAKNWRIPPPSSSEDMLGGNYLIAQQLPASSPKADLIMLHYPAKDCKHFLEKSFLEFCTFYILLIEYFQCFKAHLYIHSSGCFIFCLYFLFQIRSGRYFYCQSNSPSFHLFSTIYSMRCVSQDQYHEILLTSFPRCCLHFLKSGNN